MKSQNLGDLDPVKLNEVSRGPGPYLPASAAGELRAEAGPWKGLVIQLRGPQPMVRWVRKAAFPAPNAPVERMSWSTQAWRQGRPEPPLSPGGSLRG